MIEIGGQIAAQTAKKRADCLSMTGYAQARTERDGRVVRVSVKSVNHRFLDLKMRLPEALEMYEPRLRQIVRGRIHRGHLDVHVSIDAAKDQTVQVNRELAHAYLKAAEDLRLDSKAAAVLDMAGLLRLPGVIGGTAVAAPETEEAQEKLGAVLEECLQEALKKLDEMRRAEAKHLVEEMRSRLERISLHAEEVRNLMSALRPAFARRLEARLSELLRGAAIDPARLAQEAAVLAERSDISEELERLHSHVLQFEKLLDGAGEIGKRLDFLLQEMNREANTILSKTPGVEKEGLAVTGLALEIKSEIEKLREQVQNLE
ncbi:MAG TPA: YicC/YloC family endoribonuclease [Candidatus Dormibacteraeota bacterium]|nr:YicC/YloC family endoribonuclease [Candidatus Dormibacteraeota bacterium]